MQHLQGILSSQPIVKKLYTDKCIKFFMVRKNLFDLLDMYMHAFRQGDRNKENMGPLSWNYCSQMYSQVGKIMEFFSSEILST